MITLTGSGFVHWAGDTIGSETTPFVGPGFGTPKAEGMGASVAEIAVVSGVS